MRNSVWKLIYTIPLLIFGALMVGILLAAVAVPVLNMDFYGRTNETKTLKNETADSGAPEIRLVIRRLLPEENAVEASVQILWRYDRLPIELKDKENCLTVAVIDRGASGDRKSVV